MNTKEIIGLIQVNNLMKFYKSKEWKDGKRLEALERDNNECQHCKQRGKQRNATEVHHIKEVKKHPELALDIKNLISLCRQCHNAVHDRLAVAKAPPEFMNEERW